jgi:hypothetical protein
MSDELGDICVWIVLDDFVAAHFATGHRSLGESFTVVFVQICLAGGGVPCARFDDL